MHGSDHRRAPPVSRGVPRSTRWGIFMRTLKTVCQESRPSALVSPASRTGNMCCCCFAGFCSEFCRLIRFACCTRFKRIETKETVVFTAHVPGLREGYLQVQVEPGNLLRLIGNRSKDKASSNGLSTTTGKSSGQFVKLYKLPMNALAEEVRAEVDDDGFITITVPKSTEDKESTN